MYEASFTSTRDALHRVAVHVLARSRQQASGQISLRVTPGGLGTPDFGTEPRRVRIRTGWLIVESDAPGFPTASGVAIDGSSLRELSELAGCDPMLPLDVGGDGPPIGDIDAPIEIDEQSAAELGRWYALAEDALDRVVVALHADRQPSTLARLWPEHFDVAIETEAQPGRGVNLGGSPGDSFCSEPYCYVGPWNDERPGDPSFWNAPFGAIMTASTIGDEPGGAADFFLDGLARLR